MAEQQIHAWTPVTLPSRGVLYGDLLPGGIIQCRKLMSEEDAIIQSQGIDALTRIQTIIRNGTKLPTGFDSGDLLTTDRMAIIIAQRILTFGPKSTFTWPCKYCKGINKSDIDMLRDLDEVTPEVVEAKLAERGVTEAYGEPIEATLMDRETTVSLRFMRGKDEDDVYKRVKRARVQMNNSSNTDPTSNITLAAQIIRIDGAEKSILEREMFVRTLTARDKRLLQTTLEDRETGIDPSMMCKCAACGGDQEVGMPFDNEFFRPSVVRP